MGVSGGINEWFEIRMRVHQGFRVPLWYFIDFNDGALHEMQWLWWNDWWLRNRIGVATYIVFKKYFNGSPIKGRAEKINRQLWCTLEVDGESEDKYKVLVAYRDWGSQQISLHSEEKESDILK